MAQRLRRRPGAWPGRAAAPPHPRPRGWGPKNDPPKKFFGEFGVIGSEFFLVVVMVGFFLAAIFAVIALVLAMRVDALQRRLDGLADDRRFRDAMDTVGD